VNSALGKKIADDKELTYTLLQKYGIPVPRTLYMKKEEFDDFAWTPLEGFRFPLVVKPIDEAHGT
jgi:glutathione synthase/RimK-type ligase-like ATP-grasp enzyme